MDIQYWGIFAILFSLISGILVSMMILNGFTSNNSENFRKFVLGTICYGILTMLPFMFVFFLFNDNDNLEALEIIASIVIFVFPLLLLYLLRSFAPLKDFLLNSVILNSSIWKDFLLLVLMAGTLYSMYYYGLILGLIT